MKKVYLERRYVNCSFESTELDLNDIDVFIRSELQRYDIYESSTSSLQRNSMSPSEKQSVNTSIVSSSLGNISENIPRYCSSFSSNTSFVRSTPPGDLLSYPQQTTQTSNQDTWNTSLSPPTSASCSSLKKNNKSLSHLVSQVANASTAIKPS